MNPLTPLRPTLPTPGSCTPGARRGLAVFALLMLSCVAPVILFGCKGAETVEQQVELPPPIDVDSVAASELTIPKKLSLTGTLRGQQETDLAANVAGKVLETRAERGQGVKRGDLLARVDVSAASLALAEARVAVETSRKEQQINEADCERYEQLKQRGVVTDLEYDRVTAKCKTAPLNLEAAQARQSIAAKNVGDGVIRSPFTGVIVERYVEVGEYVQPSSRVVSLAQVDRLRLEFSLPEQHFAEVKLGAAVDFRVGAYGDRVFSGRVSHISGAVRETRDIIVEATVDNANRALLPGMFVALELTIGQEQLPSVPKAAVFADNGASNAYVVVDGILRQRVLQVAGEKDGRVAVRRGLKDGDRVVVDKLEGLQNGQRVN
jgi:membrane fusion protein, multidrug efflux system